MRKRTPRIDKRSEIILSKLNEMAKSMPSGSTLCKYYIDAESKTDPTHKLHVVSYYTGAQKPKSWDVLVPECSNLWGQFDKYELSVVYNIDASVLMYRNEAFTINDNNICCSDTSTGFHKNQNGIRLNMLVGECTFKKPTKLYINRLDGIVLEFEVSSWRDLYRKIVDYLMQYVPMSFEALVKSSAGVDTKPFATSIKNQNPSFYHKVDRRVYLYQNLSAEDVILSCLSIMSSVGVDPKNYSVELK